MREVILTRTQPGEKRRALPVTDDTADTGPITVAALDQYQSHPIVGVAARVCADLNDLLNAAALRIALLRWLPPTSRTDGDFRRLADLVAQAALTIRTLQECVNPGELEAADSRPQGRARRTIGRRRLRRD